MFGGRKFEEDLCDSMEMGAAVFFYRAGDETGGLDSECRGKGEDLQ